MPPITVKITAPITPTVVEMLPVGTIVGVSPDATVGVAVGVDVAPAPEAIIV